MSVDVKPIEGWVELELLGHRRMHGLLSIGQLGPEATGPIVLRLDVPAVDEKPTELHFYSPQAVYGIHPTTEEEVIKALTPWRPPARCEARFARPGWPNGDTCEMQAGHDGDHEGLPF